MLEHTIKDNNFYSNFTTVKYDQILQDIVNF